MSDQRPTLEPGVTYFLVPVSLMDQITRVLRKQPHEEVDQIITELRHTQLTKKQD